GVVAGDDQLGRARPGLDHGAEQRPADVVAARPAGARQLAHRPLGVAVAERQLLEADDVPLALGVDGQQHPPGLVGVTAQAEQPPAGERPQVEADDAGHEQQHEDDRHQHPDSARDLAAPGRRRRRVGGRLALAGPHGRSPPAGAAAGDGSPSRPLPPASVPSAEAPSASSTAAPGGATAGTTSSIESHSRAPTTTNIVTPPTMIPESLTALPSTAATTAATRPVRSVGIAARSCAIGRDGNRTRNTTKATATGTMADQNELVVTRRLASSLRSMIDSSGPTPSSPIRSNSRPRWARWPGGRARSSRPNPVTARTVSTRATTTVRNRTR